MKQLPCNASPQETVVSEIILWRLAPMQLAEEVFRQTHAGEDQLMDEVFQYITATEYCYGNYSECYRYIHVPHIKL